MYSPMLKKVRFFLVISLLISTINSPHYIHASQDNTLQQWVYTLLMRVESHLEKGNFDRAEDELKEYADRDWSRSSYDHAVILRTYAYFLFNQKRYREGIPYLEKALSKKAFTDLEKHMIRYSLGQIQVVLEDYEAAILTLEEWIKEGEENEFPVAPQGRALLATCYAIKNNFNPALKHITDAVNTSSKPQIKWYELKFALEYELKKLRDGLETSKTLVKLEPKKEKYIEQMAAMFSLLKFEDEALASLELGDIQKIFSDGKDLINLANYFVYKEVPRDAAELLDAALNKNIINASKRNFELAANAFIGSRDNDKAVNYLAKASKIDNDEKLDYRIGQIEMSRGKFKNAILAFEDARSKGWNEKPGKLELLIGISYVELEDFEAAKKELTLALETDESDQADMWLNYIKNVEDSMKFLQTFSG